MTLLAAECDINYDTADALIFLKHVTDTITNAVKLFAEKVDKRLKFDGDPDINITLKYASSVRKYLQRYDKTGTVGRDYVKSQLKASSEHIKIYTRFKKTDVSNEEGMYFTILKTK